MNKSTLEEILDSNSIFEELEKQKDTIEQDLSKLVEAETKLYQTKF
jgi:hypothetical protein